MDKKYLLDLNVLIALTDRDHMHYDTALTWFSGIRESWGLCPLTEAGYIRFVLNPRGGPILFTLARAVEILGDLARQPRYTYWPVTDSWTDLTEKFADRITGHQQVTDAYLLGLAIKHDGVLVTFDRGLKYLAGPEFRRNLLMLE